MLVAHGGQTLRERVQRGRDLVAAQTLTLAEACQLIVKVGERPVEVCVAEAEQLAQRFGSGGSLRPGAREQQGALLGRQLLRQQPAQRGVAATVVPA